jgi:hypothetical protein
MNTAAKQKMVGRELMALANQRKKNEENELAVKLAAATTVRSGAPVVTVAAPAKKLQTKAKAKNVVVTVVASAKKLQTKAKKIQTTTLKAKNVILLMK